MTEDDVDARLMQVVKLLTKQTANGRITWKPTDNSDTFFYSSSKASVLVDGRTDGDGDHHAKVLFLNGDGIQVGELSTTFEPDPASFGNAWISGPNNRALVSLYESARRSALRIDEVLESLLEDLQG